jgi:two-component system sensor histidine kinase EvgS
MVKLSSMAVSPDRAAPCSLRDRPTAGAGLFDRCVMEELMAIGGSNALYRRVLDLFADCVPPAIEAIASLASRRDLGELADAVHALKSMCANLGARRAVAACDALEAACRAGVAFDPAAMAEAVGREVRLVLAEVERLRAA